MRVAINGVSVSSEMKIEGTEAQTVLDRVADELPEASGGQASVVFTAPDGERLDTPERLAVISRTVSDVYELEKVVNPLDAALGAAEQGRTGHSARRMHRAIPQPGRTRRQAPPYQPLRGGRGPGARRAGVLGRAGRAVPVPVHGRLDLIDR